MYPISSEGGCRSGGTVVGVFRFTTLALGQSVIHAVVAASVDAHDRPSSWWINEHDNAQCWMSCQDVHNVSGTRTATFITMRNGWKIGSET